MSPDQPNPEPPNPKNRPDAAPTPDLPPAATPPEQPRRRPSGAPEIPEILRERPAGAGPGSGRRFGVLPTFRSASSPEMKAIAVGIELVAMALAGVLIGLGIDYLAGTGTLWTIIMGVFGFVCGIYQTVKDALALNREMTELERRRKGTRQGSGGSASERE